MTSAFGHLRVVDFTTTIAGPHCTRLLADLGAEVIKIEAPEGDMMRSRQPLRDGASTSFGQLNTGKKSVVLDLKRPAAVDAVKRLAASADVVVENFRPGVMQRFGLDYPALQAVKPDLVYCAISGYGQSGPSAGLPELRHAIAEEVGRTRSVKISDDEIVVVPGGKPIIFFIILALADVGDEVIYPNPGFPIYESMVHYVGARAVPIRLLEEKDFGFDVDELAGLAVRVEQAVLEARVAAVERLDGGAQVRGLDLDGRGALAQTAKRARNAELGQLDVLLRLKHGPSRGTISKRRLFPPGCRRGRR